MIMVEEKRIVKGEVDFQQIRKSLFIRSDRSSEAARLGSHMKSKIETTRNTCDT
jgi:hypothetical protein